MCQQGGEVFHTHNDTLTMKYSEKGKKLPISPKVERYAFI